MEYDHRRLRISFGTDRASVSNCLEEGFLRNDQDDQFSLEDFGARSLDDRRRVKQVLQQNEEDAERDVGDSEGV
ncbi:hypothetical protein MJO28_012541 [Puccinia striiformis f. sp. tritici]|uniref:Uncharacterized protein n=1 Tax=Puccinia striiformis f. sp. tritici TaxID=168172 RepID=A0ACC0E1T1_9BASI|nr:hypothetical protein MJO28_012541 [Puccinia striiformis f. sp. tritici]